MLTLDAYAASRVISLSRVAYDTEGQELELLTRVIGLAVYDESLFRWLLIRYASSEPRHNTKYSIRHTIVKEIH